jgi:hypothetical protein
MTDSQVYKDATAIEEIFSRYAIERNGELYVQLSYPTFLIKDEKKRLTLVKVSDIVEIVWSYEERKAEQSV